MHTGQITLVIGALVLLSIFIVTINSSITTNQATLYESEHTFDALAIAQRYIEQAELLNFDEDPSATIPSSFTYASELGKDTGENYPHFDDVDDFNNFTQTDTTSGNVTYTVNISVYYVTLNDPDILTTTRTYYKRMLVTISSAGLRSMPSNSITMDRLFCYHYFFTE